MENFDVIVVGGGPAGLSAAISAARSGMKVCVVERGDYPGTKNVMGGVIYTQPTNEVVPDFWKDAPLERPVIEQRYGLMSKDELFTAAYRDPAWGQPPFNAHTVLRVKFDRWLAQEAEKLGVMIIPETLVDDLLYHGDDVVGVRTTRPDGDLGAKVVILAEGANNFVAVKAGLAKPLNPDSVAVVAKEIIALPPEKIEDRFCLEPHEGATIELFGDSTDGILGTSFIYTNKDSISIGVGAMVGAMGRKGWSPNDLLENLKAKPYVKRLLQGGETKEYLAHLIPEGGYNSMPKLYRQGVMVVGDTAMLVNGLTREGSNLATTSGLIAGKVAAEAIQSGDTSAQGMSVYETRLRDSFVVKDLYKFRNLVSLLEQNPHLLGEYPEMLNQAARMYFTIDGTPKEQVFKDIMGVFTKKRGMSGLVKDMFKAWRALK